MAVNVFDRADRRVTALRSRVSSSKDAPRIQQSALTSSGLGSTSTGDGTAAFAPQTGMDQSRASRQYDAFKNTVATAIRPIMVRFAAQPIRVGYSTDRSNIETNKSLAGLRTRMAGIEFEKRVADVAPLWIKQSVGTNVTVMERHPLLDLISSPSEMLTQLGLLNCTAASLALTGRVAWWFDSTGGNRDELGFNTRLWYVPWHWLQPVGPRENPYAKFRLQSTSGASGVEIDGEDIFYAVVPHPSDPTKAWSAIQGQASAVDTDENILKAQYVSMKNVIRPSMIITAGRMPGMPGGSGSRGPRALLLRNDREKLIEAIKQSYGGVINYGEPLILDALIEDVRPFMASPHELDLTNSSAITQGRIMQGAGVSPVVAGYTENANRAGSTVAHDIFYELVLNPLIQLFGQALDAKMGRRYQSNPRLRTWMDEARPRDIDQQHERISLGLPYMKVKEVRHYVKTGALIMDDATDVDEKMVYEVGAVAAPVTPEATAEAA